MARAMARAAAAAARLVGLALALTAARVEAQLEGVFAGQGVEIGELHAVPGALDGVPTWLDPVAAGLDAQDAAAEAGDTGYCVTDFTHALSSEALGDARLAALAQKSLDAASNKLDMAVDLATVLAPNRENLLQRALAENEEMGQVFARAYIKQLVPLASPGLVLLALALLACPCCFFCSRCLCFPRAKAPREYRCCAKAVPLLIYFTMAAAAVGTALAAIMSISSFTDGSVGAVCELGDVTVRMSDFFGGLTNVTASIFYSTSYLRLDLQGADVSLPLRQAHESSEALRAAASRMSDDLGNDLPIAQRNGWPSTKMLSVASNVSSLIGLAEGLRDTVDDLDRIERRIIDSVNIAAVATNAALGALRMAKQAAHQARVFVHEAKLASADPLRNLATTSLTFFSTVFLAFAAGLVVMIAAILPYIVPCKLPGALARYLFNLSWALTYTFMILMFVLGSAFVLLTLLWTDSCGVLTWMPSHVDLVLPRLLNSSDGPDEMTALAQGLLQGAFADPPVSAGAALNLTQLFRFLSIVAVPSAAQTWLRNFTHPDYVIRNELLAPAYANLAMFSNLTATDFEADSEYVQRALDALNAATGGSYEIADCSPSPACDYRCVVSTSCAPAAENPGVPIARLDRLREETMTAIEAEGFYSQVVPGIRNAALAIRDHLDELEFALNRTRPGVAVMLQLLDAHAQTASAAFYRDQHRLSQDIRWRLAPLLSDLEATGATVWLAEGYWAVHQALCGEAKVALSRLSLCMLLIGVFAIPTLTAGLYISVRVVGSKQAAVWAEQARGVGLQQK